MGAKQLAYSDEARQKLLSGVSKLARAVRCTLGPRGRNAVLDKGWGSPNVTKDGVTVAEDIELEDPYENMGAQLVKEAASKTSDVAGDGTTTATVLAEAIYREGLKLIAAGHDPMQLTRGIQKGVDTVVESLEKMAELQSYWINVNSLEDEADDIYRTLLGNLLAPPESAPPADVLTVLKTKEIVETLEEAADAFETVANTVESIAVKEA